MSGPTASIILTDKNRDIFTGIRNIINQISEATSGEKFWINNSKRIGGTYEGEGLPFSYSIDKIEENYEKKEIEQIYEILGFYPEIEIVIIAYCNNKESHLILAEILIKTLGNYKGIVNFGGNLECENMQNCGVVKKIFYENYKKELFFYHIGDIEFLSNWIKSDKFHMIK